jgi:hypothetical protein
MSVIDGLRRALSSPSRFSETFLPEYRLRTYQADVADAIARAVFCRPALDPSPRSGRADLPERTDHASEFAAVFSRQAGKDEMLAQLCAYLLVRYSRIGGQIVVALPSLDPQGLIARDRLLARLRMPSLRAIGVRPRVREGRIVEVGQASVHYVSASPMANARGLTASLLLVANEAQDIDPERWDAVFSPMAASTNAVTLFMGTVWTADTLLSRQLRYFEELERSDGTRRRYLVPWRDVAAELPAYGEYVGRQIAQLGEDHPFIRSEYELIELDGDGGLFPPSRQGQMQGDHPPLQHAIQDETYAMLLDVAGEEEEAVDSVRRFDPHSRRDSTALTVVRVLREGNGRPRYEVVRRYLWTGVRHTDLHGQLIDLARNVWRASYLVVDATGVGAGLTSFLRDALGERVVIPFVFSQASKSKLGWDFLGIVDSGRFKEYEALTPNPSQISRRVGTGPGRGERTRRGARPCAPAAGRSTDEYEAAELSEIFWRQVRACRYHVRPGPNRMLSWEVPDARTHDDLLISAALVAALDDLDWRPRTAKGFHSRQRPAMNDRALPN